MGGPNYVEGGMNPVEGSEVGRHVKESLGALPSRAPMLDGTAPRAQRELL